MISTTRRPLYPRERPYIHCTEAAWASGPVWTAGKCQYTHKQFKLNTYHGSPYEFQVRQLGGGGFSPVHSSLNTVSPPTKNATESTGTVNTIQLRGQVISGHIPTPVKDTKPTEHTLLTIMYECTMMKVSCGLRALELANKSSAPHSPPNSA